MQRKCFVPDCARPHRSRGYCGDHYMQARRKRWPVPHPEWTPLPPPPREPVQGLLFAEERKAP